MQTSCSRSGWHGINACSTKCTACSLARSTGPKSSISPGRYAQAPRSTSLTPSTTPGMDMPSLRRCRRLRISTRWTSSSSSPRSGPGSSLLRTVVPTRRAMSTSFRQAATFLTSKLSAGCSITTRRLPALASTCPWTTRRASASTIIAWPYRPCHACRRWHRRRIHTCSA